MRKVYFDQHRTEGELPDYIPVVTAHCRGIWKCIYKDASASTPPQQPSEFDEFVFKSQTLPGDEFDQYILGQRLSIAQSAELEILAWWNESKFLYSEGIRLRPSLSLPAMSAEWERVFSSCKKMIAHDRNGPADDIIQATECLKAWWAREIIPGE